MHAPECCFSKSSTRAVNLVLVLAVSVSPSVVEPCLGSGGGSSRHWGHCGASRHCGAGGVGGCGAVEGDDAAGSRAVTVDLADNRLEGGGRAHELCERHEVTFAQEGKEVIPHIGGRCPLVDEDVLEAGEERRADGHHVVAVRDKRARDTGGVDSGSSVARGNGLVDTETVSVCLVR